MPKYELPKGIASYCEDNGFEEFSPEWYKCNKPSKGCMKESFDEKNGYDFFKYSECMKRNKKEGGRRSRRNKKSRKARRSRRR
jgi:hypothetical protein